MCTCAKMDLFQAKSAPPGYSVMTTSEFTPCPAQILCQLCGKGPPAYPKRASLSFDNLIEDSFFTEQWYPNHLTSPLPPSCSMENENPSAGPFLDRLPPPEPDPPAPTTAEDARLVSTSSGFLDLLDPFPPYHHHEPHNYHPNSYCEPLVDQSSAELIVTTAISTSTLIVPTYSPTNSYFCDDPSSNRSSPSDYLPTTTTALSMKQKKSLVLNYETMNMWPNSASANNHHPFDGFHDDLRSQQHEECPPYSHDIYALPADLQDLDSLMNCDMKDLLEYLDVPGTSVNSPAPVVPATMTTHDAPNTTQPQYIPTTVHYAPQQAIPSTSWQILDNGVVGVGGPVAELQREPSPLEEFFPELSPTHVSSSSTAFPSHSPDSSRDCHSVSQNPDSDYRLRRDKNNVSSQRSRAKRRDKITALKDERSQLERTNIQLRSNLSMLESQVADYKKMLREVTLR